MDEREMRIRKDERGRVLEELEKWVDNRLQPPNNVPKTSNVKFCSVKEIVEKIAELRVGG